MTDDTTDGATDGATDDATSSGPTLPVLGRPLRRAEFLALLWLGLAAGQAALVGGTLGTGGTPDPFDAVLVVGFLVLGGVYLRRPGAVRDGTDPAPGLWYGLVAAGVVLLAGVALAYAV
jgi:hypothetical protein